MLAELAMNLFELCECKRCLKCVVDVVDIWTRAHFIYTSDGDIELIRTPLYDLKQIVETGHFDGDCDDVAVFLAAIFKALGMQTRFVAIKTEPIEHYSHVFIETLAGDTWVSVDPTVPPKTVHHDFGRMVQYA